MAARRVRRTHSAGKHEDGRVTTEYAGKGDQRRSMELLWGRFEPPAKGPRRDLSVAAIAAAGVVVADAEGLEAVSMRRVAKELDRSTMSLYTYVPAKSELLDVMLEQVLGELPTSHSRGYRWRAAVEGWARERWAFYGRHPWVLQISGARPLLSPHEFDGYEASLALFEGLGLEPLEVSQMVGALVSFIAGAAKAVADTRTAEQATGVAEVEWWRIRSGLLEELAIDETWPERYPTITRLQAARVFDQPDRVPDDASGYLEHEEITAFEFGLTLLLDGLATRIDPGISRRP